MRGHWIGGTRKLNRHWQSGEGITLPWSPSQPFDSIEYNGEDYVFAPAYNLDFLVANSRYLWLSFHAHNSVSDGTIQLASNVPLKTTVNGIGGDGVACDFIHYKKINNVETKIVTPMSAGWKTALHHKCIRPYYDLWQLAPRTLNSLWNTDLTNFRDLWSKLSTVNYQGTLNLVDDFMTGTGSEYYIPYFIDADSRLHSMPLNLYYYIEDGSGNSYVDGVGPSYQDFGYVDWGMGDDWKDCKAITADRCCGNVNSIGNVPTNPMIPWFLVVGWDDHCFLWALKRLELVENMYWNEVTY